MVAQYQFNDNADDGTGTRHGVVSGAVTYADAPGDVGNKAITFDGSNYVAVDTPFATRETEFSIEVYLTPTGWDAAFHGFVGYQDSTRSPSMWVCSERVAQGPGESGPNRGLHWDLRTTQTGDGTRFAGVEPGWFTQVRGHHAAGAAVNVLPRIISIAHDRIAHDLHMIIIAHRSPSFSSGPTRRRRRMNSSTRSGLGPPRRRRSTGTGSSSRPAPRRRKVRAAVDSRVAISSRVKGPMIRANILSPWTLRNPDIMSCIQSLAWCDATD